MGLYLQTIYSLLGTSKQWFRIETRWGLQNYPQGTWNSDYIVGGFNPICFFVNWKSSSKMDESKKMLKPPSWSWTNSKNNSQYGKYAISCYRLSHPTDDITYYKRHLNGTVHLFHAQFCESISSFHPPHWKSSSMLNQSNMSNKHHDMESIYPNK